VILCAFGPNNVKLLLSSGIGLPYDPATGQGTVGRHSTYQTMAAVNVFHPERVRINPFMGAGALGTVLDDNGDNFDHAGLGFVDGGYVSANSTGARPIEYHPGPPGKRAGNGSIPGSHHKPPHHGRGSESQGHHPYSCLVVMLTCHRLIMPSLTPIRWVC
jgi:hypothetical protein